MDRIATWASTLLTPFDLAALVLLAGGLLYGARRGLGPTFGLLLWTVVALWLARALAPTLLAWMANTEGTGRSATRVTTYGLLAALVLALPLVARLAGGTGGRKRTDPEVRDRPFGMLVGAVVALLLLALAAPFAARAGLDGGGAPGRARGLARDVASVAPWLYPPELRDELAGADPPAARRDRGAVMEDPDG